MAYAYEYVFPYFSERLDTFNLNFKTKCLKQERMLQKDY